MTKTLHQIKNASIICTETDFRSYKSIFNEKNGVYEDYLGKNTKILNLECDKIVEPISKNKHNSDISIKFKKLDIFDLDKVFKKDSFDVCISQSVIEHFSKGQIRDIIDKQLSIAPIVITSFPVRTKRTLNYYGVKDVHGKELCNDNVYRNIWTEHVWMEDILKFYDIEQSYIKRNSPPIGNFDEMFVVIERDYTGKEFEGLVDEEDREIRMGELFTGSYGWDEELSAFELYFMNCFDFPFKAQFRSSDYGDNKTIFTVIRITCCRDKGGVFCEIRFDDGIRKEVPIYSIYPIDKMHKRKVALNDYLTWLPFKV
jgi:hypothetical protein